MVADATALAYPGLWGAWVRLRLAAAARKLRTLATNTVNLMRTRLMGIGLALGLGALAPAQASNDVDFGTLNCSQFLAIVEGSDEQASGAMFMWLDGYLSGVSGDNVMRPDAMAPFVEALLAHCGNNGKAKLLDAAKAVGLNG
jgi:acid stress chaperone HdeB